MTMEETPSALLTLDFSISVCHPIIFHLLAKFSDPNYSLNRKRERFKIFEVESR